MKNLEHNPDFVGRKPAPGLLSRLKAKIKSMLGMKAKAVPAAPVQRDDSALGASPAIVSAYLGNLRITPVPDTDLVKIGYISPDPNLAAELANAHAKAYIDQGIALHSQANEAARKFLESRLTELKKQLEQSEVALNAYRQDNGIIPGLISLDGKETVVMDRMTELSKSLTEAEVQKISLESEMQLIREGQYDALPQVVADTGATALKGQMDELDAEYASMSKQFKDDYPPMQQLRAKRAQLANLVPG